MNRAFTESRRELRKRQTPEERKLWKDLRSRRFEGFKFRRQHSIGCYIVDFVCLDQKLIVELDGKSHRELFGKARDGERDAYLKNQGYRILRVWNSEIQRKLTKFLAKLEQVLISPSPRPSPQGGEGGL